MKKNKLFLLVLMLFAGSLFAQTDMFGINDAKQMHAKLKKVQPKNSQGNLVYHSDYILSYSEPNEQAEWVLYELTSSELGHRTKRSDDFREDPLIKTGSATPADYAKSGYDRGHLAPAADMSANPKLMSESFFMSNMSPQAPQFNRGVWKKLEQQVRDWANAYHKIYVLTGPVLTEPLYDSIGKNRVTVPLHYYKVIYLDNPGDDDHMIGFLLKNEGSKEDLSHFVVSVDEIEKLTGLDVFPQLEDQLEDELESNIDTNFWTFDVSSSAKRPAPAKKAEKELKKAVKCKGISKSSGKPCKKMTKNPNGYCNLHQNQVK